jgi:hypothetical protein
MDDQYRDPQNWSNKPRKPGRGWMKPGPYYGIGPRGYQRSDHRIREDVCERLTQHGLIDARRIIVRVNNGEVTLQGTVQDRRAKRMAEDTASSVAAVSDVLNLLRLHSLPGRKEPAKRQAERRTPSSSSRKHPSDRSRGRHGRQGALVFETNGDKEE